MKIEAGARVVTGGRLSEVGNLWYKNKRAKMMDRKLGNR